MVVVNYIEKISLIRSSRRLNYRRPETVIRKTREPLLDRDRGSQDPELVQLVLRARDGDEGSFEELFKLLSGRMLNHIAGMIGYDEEAARDLLQEVFVRIHARLSSLKEPEKFLAWLYAIASNLSRDHLRRRKREPVADTDLVERAEAGTKDSGAEDTIRLIREIVAEMPSELKQVFLLKKMGEMTFEEIAGYIGCSSRTVKTRMEKAWNLLQRGLRAKGIRTQ